MNIIVKILASISIAIIWVGVTYGCIRTIIGVWQKNIDMPFTLRALRQGLTQPPATLNFLQERAYLAMELLSLPATVNIFEDRQATIEGSKLKGLDQYSLAIYNRGRVIVREVNLRCQFPRCVLDHRFTSKPSTGKVNFTPAGSGEWTVLGSGTVKVLGKISSPYYQLKIEALSPKEMVRLRVSLPSGSSSHPAPFEGMPDFPKDKAYFIAGTYKQKVGDDMVELQIYYPLISDENDKIHLGPYGRELPQDLLYGSGFD